jgi:hypothetical protein
MKGDAMRKGKIEIPKERVLARVLAEDFRELGLASGGGDTVNLTYQGGSGQPDITNVGWDADKPEV